MLWFICQITLDVNSQTRIAARHPEASRSPAHNRIRKGAINMKKYFSFILAIIMVLSLGSALAEGRTKTPAGQIEGGAFAIGVEHGNGKQFDGRRES